MTSHPNRGWRSRWVVDLAAREARHRPSGLVVRFTRATNDTQAHDGRAVNGAEIAAALTEAHGAGKAARMLARLMREAGEICIEAMR